MAQWFLDRIAARGDRPAFIAGAEVATHGGIAGLAAAWNARLAAEGVAEGATVIVHSDYSAEAVSLIFALAARRTIVVPLTPVSEDTLASRAGTAGADWIVVPGGGPESASFTALSPREVPPLAAELRGRGRAGLILFSSGSTGEPKACLLDLESLLEMTRTERRGWRSLVFLLLDHIGGINTTISVLGHGGTAVMVADRSVDTVAGAIAEHRVELLPTSPTFLNMLLIARANERYDLSSLEMITYGTEVMPVATLTALRAAFPDVRLKQTYGLSEIGIVPTRSRADGSLWMQIGGAGVEYRIVDDILHVRAPTAMLGYLNAPSPFDAEGWLDTRDRVEVDRDETGEWLHILGRESELINVGGEKVHPAEVENVLLQAPNIADVTVSARKSPITGAVVMASVTLVEPEDQAALRARLDAFCRERLEAYKVPAIFKLAREPLHSDRFKKIRVKSA